MFHGLIGLNYIASQIIGIVLGLLIVLYLIKIGLSLQIINKKTGHELFRFIVVNLISLIITLILMNFSVRNFNINVYVSKIIVTFIAQITNFISYKLWIFNETLSEDIHSN